MNKHRAPHDRYRIALRLTTCSALAIGLFPAAAWAQLGTPPVADDQEIIVIKIDEPGSSGLAYAGVARG